MATWTTASFPAGNTLAYQSSLNDKPFATQWTSLADVTPDGLVELQTLVEIDTAVLGQGGSPYRQRTRLLCTTDFEPVRYEIESSGKSWSLDFEGDAIVVHPPGGDAPQRLPRGGAEFLFGAVGHQAIIVAVLGERGRLDDATLTVFLPDPLMAVPYRLWRAPDLGEGHWLCSSHEEELLVDADGRLREVRLPKRGVRTVLLEPPPALPAWSREASIARAAVKYAPPADSHFQLLDVTIPGPVTPIGATLTVPRGTGPFPAVLFLSGSGAHDRHGIAGEIDIGTHEIVDFLAERGFAGLRYDTRGAGTTRFGRDALDFGLSALLDDAVACLEFLRNRPEVEPQRVALIGHSEGGLVALALAVRRGAAPKAIVLMASLGRTLDEVMFDQLESQGRVMGLSDAQIESQRKELRAFVDLARSDRPSEPGALPDHLLGLLRSRTWLREHLEHPATTLVAQLRCRLLVCHGEKDFQVSRERDAERLVAAARAASVDVDFMTFPDLDHLFKHADGESTMAQYYDARRHVSADFLARLHGWLVDAVGTRPDHVVPPAANST